MPKANAQEQQTKSKIKTRSQGKNVKRAAPSTIQSLVSPAKKQKRNTFEEKSFRFELPFYKTKVQQVLKELEDVSPFDVKLLRRHTETLIALVNLAKIEEKEQAIRALIRELATALTLPSRCVYASVLTEVLQNLPNVSLDELQSIERDVFSKKTEGNLTGKIYYSLCLFQSGRNKIETAQLYLPQYTAIAKQHTLLAPVVLSALAAIANKLSYDKNAKKIIQPVVQDLLPSSVTEYKLQHFEATYAVLNLSSSEDESWIRSLSEALIAHERERFLPGVHFLWKHLVTLLAGSQAEFANNVWSKVDETFFGSQEASETWQINRATTGFEIVTIAAREFPSSHYSGLFSTNLLWHISFALTRDNTLQKPQLLKKPKPGSNIPYILNLPEEILFPVTSNSGTLDRLLDAIKSKAKENAANGGVMYDLFIQRGKNFAHIKKLTSAMKPVESAESLKTFLEKLKDSRPEEVLNSIPVSFASLKLLKQDDLFELLTLLFANGFFEPKKKGLRGTKDDVIIYDDILVSMRNQFMIRFFKILDTITRKEVEFYENKTPKKNLMYHWSQRFAELYQSDFLNHETLVSIEKFTPEYTAARQKLWAIIEKLSKVENNNLDLIGIRIFVYRIILYQLNTPSNVDESIIEELETYLDVTYFGKKEEEGTNPVEILTDVLLYFFRKTNLFIEITTFILLNKKSELTNRALDSVFKVVRKPLKVYDKREREKDGDDESDESDEDDDINKSSESALSPSIFANGDIDDSNLDDEAMFKLDAQIAKAVAKRIRTTTQPQFIFHSAYRVLDLIQALYLLNPSSKAEIQSDKKYKIMIFCRLVDLLLYMEKKRNKFQSTQKELMNRVARLVRGALQAKYCRFLIPPVTFVNKLNNPLFVDSSEKHPAIFTPEIVEEVNERLEQLVEFISTQSAHSSADELSMERLIQRSFAFILQVLYFQSGKHFAQVAVDTLNKCVPYHFHMPYILPHLEFMVPDILDTMHNSITKLKKSDYPKNLTQYQFQFLQALNSLVPMMVQHKRIHYVHQANKLVELFEKICTALEEGSAGLQEKMANKQEKGTKLNSILFKKAPFLLITAAADCLHLMLNEISRTFIDVIKLDKQVMVNICKELSKATEILRVLKKSRLGPQPKTIYTLHTVFASIKTVLKHQYPGDEQLLRSLARPSKMAADTSTKNNGHPQETIVEKAVEQMQEADDDDEDDE